MMFSTTTKPFSRYGIFTDLFKEDIYRSWWRYQCLFWCQVVPKGRRLVEREQSKKKQFTKVQVQTFYIECCHLLGNIRMHWNFEYAATLRMLLVTKTSIAQTKSLWSLFICFPMVWSIRTAIFVIIHKDIRYCRIAIHLYILKKCWLRVTFLVQCRFGVRNYGWDYYIIVSGYGHDSCLLVICSMAILMIVIRPIGIDYLSGVESVKHIIWFWYSQ